MMELEPERARELARRANTFISGSQKVVEQASYEILMVITERGFIRVEITEHRASGRF